MAVLMTVRRLSPDRSRHWTDLDFPKLAVTPLALAQDGPDQSVLAAYYKHIILAVVIAILALIAARFVR